MTELNNKYSELLTAHRRQLHAIPELDRELPKTKAYLLSVLESLDCRLTFLCGDGICAFFDKGKKETCAFRADMDGLPVQEETGCSYTSTHEGRMHACGHDGHMAMVLTLGQYVDATDNIDCNVLLIFQPAEETLGGAEEICQSGVLEKYNVTRVFGIHLWPFFEGGVIGSKSGALMPRSAEINVHIGGQSTHGTAPYSGLDALYIGADYVKAVYAQQAMLPGAIPRFRDGIGDLPVPEEAAPEERTLIHFGKMESGYARNVVSDYTHLLGTVRAYDDERFAQILDILKSQLARIEKTYGCSVEFHNTDGYPPLINNPQLYQSIMPLVKKNELPYIEMELPLMISEDFSFYNHYAPSMFFLLGTGTDIPLHSRRFDYDEKVLLSGFKLYCALLGRE